MLLLTACGGDPSRDGKRNASEQAAGFPVRVEHRYGVTELPHPPRRIVTVGLTEQDYVLALGQAPVGTREWFGDRPGALWPWAVRALGGKPMPT